MNGKIWPAFAILLVTCVIYVWFNKNRKEGIASGSIEWTCSEWMENWCVCVKPEGYQGYSVALPCSGVPRRFLTKKSTKQI